MSAVAFTRVKYIVTFLLIIVLRLAQEQVIITKEGGARLWFITFELYLLILETS